MTQDNGKPVRQIFEFLVSAICPSVTDQPREIFDLDDLKDLAESIKTVGQRQAIAVRKRRPEEMKEREPGCEYEIVDGERRWRACRMIGKTTIEAELVVYKAKKAQFVDAAIRNICKADHAPLEKAKIIKRLMEDHGLSVEQTARALGYSEVWTYQHLQLLDLPPDLQARMHPDTPKEKRISFDLGRSISKLPRRLQDRIVERTVGKGLTRPQQLAKAKRIIADSGFKPKMHGRQRERSGHEYRKFVNFGKRIAADSSLYGGKTLAELGKMFLGRGRVPKDLDSFALSLDASLAKLKGLKKKIERLKRKRDERKTEEHADQTANPPS